MQLGEVFEETEAAAPPPRPKRRGGRLLAWLMVIGIVAGALLVHGPGIEKVPAATALVVTNDTGWDWLGPPARVARHTPGFAGWIPVAQHAWRISLRRRRTDGVDVVVRTADGAPVQLRNATATYRVRPTDAAITFRRLGTVGAAWDRVVRGWIALAWSNVARRERLIALRSLDPSALLIDVRRQLEARLDAHGFELLDLTAPRWQPPSRIADALDAERAARRAEAEVIAATAASVESAALRDLELQATQDVEDAAHAAILEAEIEAARMEADAAIAAARRAATTRRHAAEAERSARFTRAAVIDTVAPREAEGLAARVEAIGGDGARLLDEAILEHVLPALERTADQ